MRDWLFERPGRLWAVTGIACVTGLVLAVVVLIVRVDRTADALERRTAEPSITVSTGGESFGITPDPAPTRRPLGPTEPDITPTSIDTNAFVDAGDPEPRVIAAINAWADWQFEDFATYMLPAAEEDATANPPGSQPGDLKITGVAEVVEPGPSQSVVKVPTNKGTLLVDVVIQDRQWWIASMGWQ